MDKRKPEVVIIAVELDNGSCAVTQMVTREHPQMVDDSGVPTPGWEVEPTAENVEALLDKVFALEATKWVRWNFISSEEYHGRERTFRNAWKLTQEGKIDVDMERAKEVWRDKLRQDRASAFATLDAAYMIADEAGNTSEKNRIASQKQKLRDITKDPRIAAAKTPDDLKQVLLG